MSKEKDKSVINKDVLKNNIIIHRAFVGKELTPEKSAEFAAIVNQRRPYCSADFVPQSFIPDLSNLDYCGR